MFRDMERCSRLEKISTWSELQYLAISNRCTRNWLDKKKNTMVTEVSQPDFRASEVSWEWRRAKTVMPSLSGHIPRLIAPGKALTPTMQVAGA